MLIYVLIIPVVHHLQAPVSNLCPDKLTWSCEKTTLGPSNRRVPAVSSKLRPLLTPDDPLSRRQKIGLGDKITRLTLAKRCAAGQREGAKELIHVADIKMDDGRSREDPGVQTKAGNCTLDPF